MQWIWGFFFYLSLPGFAPPCGWWSGYGGGGVCHHDRMEVKTSFLQKVVRRQAIGHWVLSMWGARNNARPCGPGCPLRPAAGALRASLVSVQQQNQQKEMRSHAAVQTLPWDLLCLPSSAVCNLHDLHTWRLQTDPHWVPDDLICATILS